MSGKNLMLAIAVAFAALGSGSAVRSAEENQAALLKAIGSAKVSLQQGIAQVAKGPEVPTEAKYEMEDGKLMLSVYTSAKPFDTAAEDNAFNEYSGEARLSRWQALPGAHPAGARLRPHRPGRGNSVQSQD